MYAALIKQEKPPTIESLGGLVEVQRLTKQYKPLLKTLAQVIEEKKDLDVLGDELKELESDAPLVSAVVAAAPVMLNVTLPFSETMDCSEPCAFPIDVNA